MEEEDIYTPLQTSFKKQEIHYPRKKISPTFIRRPKTTNLRTLIKNREVCQGITQMHGIQWFSSAKLFQAFQRRCKKAVKRDSEYIQVNFLATNKSMSYLTSTLKMLKSVSNGTKIEIVLAENYKITNFSVKLIAQSLRYLKEARSIVVDMAHCDRINDKGFLSLTKSLPALRKLRKLKLIFGGDNWTNQSLKNLGVCLRKLKNQLEYLTLYVIKCHKITDDGIETLCQYICQLSKLKVLNLHFCWLDGITDKGFSRLRQALAGLTSLTSLTLDLMRCTRLQSEGWQSITEGMEHFNTLTSLNLTFFKFEFLGDKELESLAQAIANQRNLKELTLRFAICGQITDEGLALVNKGISNLTSLNSLVLNVIESIKVSNEGVFSLSEAIDSLPDIKHIELSFFRCPLITEEGQEEIIRLGKIKKSNLPIDEV